MYNYTFWIDGETHTLTIEPTEKVFPLQISCSCGLCSSYNPDDESHHPVNDFDDPHYNAWLNANLEIHDKLKISSPVPTHKSVKIESIYLFVDNYTKGDGEISVTISIGKSLNRMEIRYRSIGSLTMNFFEIVQELGLKNTDLCVEVVCDSGQVSVFTINDAQLENPQFLDPVEHILHDGLDDELMSVAITALRIVRRQAKK